MFNSARRHGAQFGRQAWSRFARPQNNGYGRRWLSNVPLNQRHPEPYTQGKILLTAAAIVIGYCGYDRFAGKSMVDFENKRISQREYQFEIREKTSRDTDTRRTVSKLLEESSKPADWDNNPAIFKASTTGAATALHVSPKDAEAHLIGHAGVLVLDIDETWNTKNFCTKILETAGYPVDEHKAENPEERVIRLMQRLARSARGPTVLLLKKTANKEVAAAIQKTFVEPALGGAFGMFVVEIQ